MTIHLTIATSPREIDDALRVRYEVLVKEEKKFTHYACAGGRLVDRFDAFPQVYNLVAYDVNEPVATIRLVKECGVKLPADHYFDFGRFRDLIREKMLNQLRSFNSFAEEPTPIFGSAGMLAVRRPWRARRDVIRAMFQLAAGICWSTDVTHIFAVVNHVSANMYRRLGFAPLADKVWNDEIGSFIVPLSNSARHFVAWAFAGMPESARSQCRLSFENLLAGSTARIPARQLLLASLNRNEARA